MNSANKGASSSITPQPEIITNRILLSGDFSRSQFKKEPKLVSTISHHFPNTTSDSKNQKRQSQMNEPNRFSKLNLGQKVSFYDLSGKGLVLADN
jgi:hypothetical protein